jgi:hypothetical protein
MMKKAGSSSLCTGKTDKEIAINVFGVCPPQNFRLLTALLPNIDP